MKRKAAGKWAEEWLWSLIFYLIYELFTSPSFSRASLAWYAVIGQNASTTDWARLYMVHARRRPGIEMTVWQRHLHLPSSPPPPPPISSRLWEIKRASSQVCLCVCHGVCVRRCDWWISTFNVCLFKRPGALSRWGAINNLLLYRPSSVSRVSFWNECMSQSEVLRYKTFSRLRCEPVWPNGKALGW